MVRGRWGCKRQVDTSLGAAFIISSMLQTFSLALFASTKLEAPPLRCRWQVVGEYISGGRSRWDAAEILTGALMERAEIVFTTLSSTGRRAFQQGRKFDLVLVDEAAQASEVATLQPLALASGRCTICIFFVFVLPHLFDVCRCGHVVAHYRRSCAAVDRARVLALCRAAMYC